MDLFLIHRLTEFGSRVVLLFATVVSCLALQRPAQGATPRDCQVVVKGEAVAAQPSWYKGEMQKLAQELPPFFIYGRWGERPSFGGLNLLANEAPQMLASLPTLPMSPGSKLYVDFSLTEMPSAPADLASLPNYTNRSFEVDTSLVQGELKNALTGQAAAATKHNLFLLYTALTAASNSSALVLTESITLEPEFGSSARSFAESKLAIEKIHARKREGATDLEAMIGNYPGDVAALVERNHPFLQLVSVAISALDGRPLDASDDMVLVAYMFRLTPQNP